MAQLQAKLGRTIQRLRKDAGYSQESFADEVGVHRTYMGAVERGEKNISLRNIERIADALKIRTSELLRRAENA
ncbi:MAG TPA: helix-turn-helix transcriptional regulator [Gemmatimonadaceae bacterium]|nr:helix-turn-helix transcriptional regulator [Gemmatimonadaceae bacterium]